MELYISIPGCGPHVLHLLLSLYKTIMIVVTDSGSTKADWVFATPKGTHSLVQTMGLNPFFHSADVIERVLGDELVPHADLAMVDAVYFYGSGCSDAKRVGIMTDGLQRVFPKAYIQVDHDLLAAARATCGHEQGIACILGTGSNSCLFDGIHILDNITSLGYLVGDEGSGSHLGKYLIRGYFYREMPSHIASKFCIEFASDKSAVLDQIYGTSPNVYLASLATFVHQHLEEPYIRDLAMTSFRTFIQRHILKYPNHQELPVHFIGSIAYHFGDLLHDILKEFQLSPGIILRKPIDRLVAYHQEQAGEPLQ